MKTVLSLRTVVDIYIISYLTDIHGAKKSGGIIGGGFNGGVGGVPVDPGFGVDIGGKGGMAGPASGMFVIFSL